MRHLVFDAQVILDVLLEREGSSQAEQLLEFVQSGKVCGWYAACSLPVIKYVLSQELHQRGAEPLEAKEMVWGYLAWLASCLQPLSLPGQEAQRDIMGAQDVEDALIAISCRALGKGTLLVTGDPDFDAMGAATCVTPAECLAILVSPPSESLESLLFCDLAEQQRHLLPALENHIATVLRHGQYILGAEVRELEKRLASFTGVRHCISCSSGTDALLMPLMALGVGPGDAIFTTPFTFFATAEVIALLGATPVFVDIDPQTFNIDPEKLALAIRAVETRDPSLHPLPAACRSHGVSPAPKGIIPVDLFGVPADYDRITEIARRHSLFVLEDAAQSFGAEDRGRRAGSFGHVAATSFFPAKPLGCYGDGGAVLTNDDSLAEALRSIRVHGMGADKYENIRIGINGRMDTLQAAILLPKLEIFPEELRTRQRVAAAYSAGLQTVSGLTPPVVPEWKLSAWAQYSVLAEDTDKRQAFLQGLQASGVPTAIYYPKPLHMQAAFSSLGYRLEDFPISLDCSRRIFSLPMHPYLTAERISSIVAVMQQIVRNG